MQHFTMRTDTIIYSLLMCFIVLLGACGLIPSLGCELEMTRQYIQSTCGLTNGVRFEELIVDTFYHDGKPKIYKVVCSYSANPYANSNKVGDRIFFEGRDNSCYWGEDSATNGVYKNFGVSRAKLDSTEDFSQDSVVELKTYVIVDTMVSIGRKPPRNIAQYSARVAIKCPLRFKPNTWYYVDFRDQRYEAYLYIDSAMTYNLSKINKPTNF
jgi:hypothetical protein